MGLVVVAVKMGRSQSALVAENGLQRKHRRVAVIVAHRPSPRVKQQNSSEGQPENPVVQTQPKGAEEPYSAEQA